jgi:hypothetical protein
MAVLVSTFSRKETRLTYFRSSLGMYPISLSYTFATHSGLYLAKAPPPTRRYIPDPSETLSNIIRLPVSKTLSRTEPPTSELHAPLVPERGRHPRVV